MSLRSPPSIRGRVRSSTRWSPPRLARACARRAADFWFPNDGTLLWIPQVIDLESIVPGRFGQPIVARLADGVRVEALAPGLEVLARGLPERYGGSARYAEIVEGMNRTDGVIDGRRTASGSERPETS